MVRRHREADGDNCATPRACTPSHGRQPSPSWRLLACVQVNDFAPYLYVPGPQRVDAATAAGGAGAAAPAPWTPAELSTLQAFWNGRSGGAGARHTCVCQSYPCTLHVCRGVPLLPLPPPAPAGTATQHNNGATPACPATSRQAPVRVPHCFHHDAARTPHHVLPASQPVRHRVPAPGAPAGRQHEKGRHGAGLCAGSRGCNARSAAGHAICRHRNP